MKRFNRWICAIVGWWRSLKYGGNWDGCDYVDELDHVPAYVTVSRCSVCGKYSISWSPRETEPKL